MKIIASRTAVLAALLMALLLAGVPSSRAYSFGAAGIGLDGLYSFPGNEIDEVVISSPWLISVASTANGATSDPHSDGGLDEFYTSDSLVDEADGSAEAGNDCCGIYGLAYTTSGGVPGAYNANGSGTATMANTFVVSSGEGFEEGAVFVSFEADLSWSVGAFSDLPGYSAGASAYFKMFLDDEEILSKLVSASSLKGAGEDGTSDFDTLIADLTLEYGREYSLRIEISASSFAIGDGSEPPCCGEEPVPEPSTVLATSIGFGLLAFHRFRKRARA